MKRILFLMLAVVVLAGIGSLSGCCCNRPAACGGNCLVDGSCGTCADCPETCQACDCGECGAYDQCYGCSQNESCPQGCSDVECCGYEEGFAERCCSGLLNCLFPCKHKRTAVASRPDAGRFGQGTGGVVVYPYYTTRGPRDFFAKNPRNIGP